MLDSSLSLYKLMVLYMLQEADAPLSNAQISGFVVGGQYTSYLRIQSVLADMTETGLVSVKSVNHMTWYKPTDEGRQVAELLDTELSESIKKEIRDFLSRISKGLRTVSAARAEYTFDSDRGYSVDCTISETDSELFRLSIGVPTEAAARSLCETWKVKGQDVYAGIIRELLN